MVRGREIPESEPKTVHAGDTEMRAGFVVVENELKR